MNPFNPFMVSVDMVIRSVKAILPNLLKISFYINVFKNNRLNNMNIWNRWNLPVVFLMFLVSLYHFFTCLILNTSSVCIVSCALTFATTQVTFSNTKDQRDLVLFLNILYMIRFYCLLSMKCLVDNLADLVQIFHWW